jgi:hypothetical protein
MSSITSSFPVALAGIRHNLNGLTEASQQVAHASVDGAEAIDHAVSAVQALEHRNGVDASAAALQRANDALGTLFDALV